jgi:oligogalacturonide lyase
MNSPGVFAGALLAAFCGLAVAEVPREWVDPDTGHRITRLTDEPGSLSLYFNQNGITADGRSLVYSVGGEIRLLDLATRQSRRLVEGPARIVEAGRRTPRVYFIRDRAAWWIDTATGETAKIGDLPSRGGVVTVNADETLLAGTFIEGDAGPRFGPAEPGPRPPVSRRDRGLTIEARWAAKLPMALFTMRVDGGETTVVHRDTAWLNHLLWSPTDPRMLAFCHEGPWHKVERMWTIDVERGIVSKIHTRTMAMEIYGHEFWSADGRAIWYDLQTPRSQVFWLARFEPSTGNRTWYHLDRDEWSIHFNVSRDGSLLCGDGGDPGQVARAENGMWIWLFRPELRRDDGTGEPGLIQTGTLRAERLVNMAKHDYDLEPNVSFTPDQKRVIFRSNMFGDSYVFAVDVDAAAGER